MSSLHVLILSEIVAKLRFRTLWTNSKKPKYRGSFSCESPRCGQVANRLEAFHVVDQVSDVDQPPCPRNPEQACIHAAATSCLRGRIVLPKRLIRVQPPGIPDEPAGFAGPTPGSHGIWKMYPLLSDPDLATAICFPSGLHARP